MIEHKNTVYNRSTPLRNITLILYGSKLYHLSINALFFKLTSIVFPMNNQKQNTISEDYIENAGLKVESQCTKSEYPSCSSNQEVSNEPQHR